MILKASECIATTAVCTISSYGRAHLGEKILSSVARPKIAQAVGAIYANSLLFQYMENSQASLDKKAVCILNSIITSMMIGTQSKIDGTSINLNAYIIYSLVVNLIITGACMRGMGNMEGLALGSFIAFTRSRMIYDPELAMHPQRRWTGIEVRQ